MNAWLDELVAKGHAANPIEALKHMHELAESVLSPDSKINKLIDQKVEEVLQTSMDPFNKEQRERIIYTKLTEIFQEHPELAGDRKYQGENYDEKLMRRAGHQMAYAFTVKALMAIATKYEPDEKRRKFTRLVCDAKIQHTLSSQVEATFLQGGRDPVSYDKYGSLNIGEARRNCLEYQGIRTEIIDSLNHLTPELALNVSRSVNEKISQIAAYQYLVKFYPFLDHIDHKEGGDEAHKLASHVAGTSTIFDLNIDVVGVVFKDLQEVSKLLYRYARINGGMNKVGTLMTKEDGLDEEGKIKVSNEILAKLEAWRDEK